MNKFHRRCGDRVTLLNHSLTAIRNFVEFNHGLILGADPLIDDLMFEVRIDRKVNVWNGSLEIGVTTLDPEYMELPATATKLRNTAWILSGNSIVKDGVTLVNVYGPELDSLREGDSVGVMRSSKGELMFSVNGRCLGVAAKDMPARLFAVIDLYGQCVQVSIMQNNSYACTRLPIDSMDDIEEYLEDDEDRQQGEAAAWSEPRTSRNAHVQIPIVCPLVSQDHLRFHPRCGILVKLSYNNKTAERARPLDDYNNGVVMTHRPLYDNELFEIRIDRLVDKWSGSIEVGVTTHNPATIRFPSTMTNMESGTIMMSGSKVLLNGHGTCMEYGNFNLDELREGDTVGMMRKGNGKLHYFINGIDQGVATDKVAAQVWGVIDLYGMTVRVTIVDPCEDLDSNTHHLPIRAYSTPQLPSSYRPAIDEESLLFHTVRDSNVIIINDGRTAHRPNAFELFNNGIVMTNRTLKTNELFQVRLDLVIPKWAGSIEIGVTQHSSKDIKFPYRMSSEKSGTWAIMGEDVLRDGIVIIPQYVRNLNKLVEGDTVGVMRKDMGILHFYVNGIDQGPAAFNIPEHVFGIIDLYGRVAQGTIVDMYVPPLSSTPESPMSSESNATVFPEMCFHRVNGENVRLSRHRLTASRTTVYSEFNDAILFSSRPLRECDMFEIRIEKMVDCWIGSLEIGVTAIRPDDLEANGGVGAIAGTATDLTWDTYILSGAAMMKDGECVRSGYPLDLDLLTVGSRVGIMWHADRSLHYYLDGMDMGKAWYVPHLNIYAVVDLYGQCTQVSIVQTGDRNYNYNGCSGEHFIRRRGHIAPQPPYWSFSEYCGHNIVMRKEYSIAHRMTTEFQGAMVFSTSHLAIDDIFEIQIVESKYIFAGSFRMGVTDINILNANVNRNLPYNISSLPHYTAYIDGQYMRYSKPATRKQDLRVFTPSFEWLRPGDRVGFKKTADSRVLVYYNSELLDLAFEKVPDKVYVVCELGGHVYMIKTVPRGAPIALPSQQTIKNDSETMEQPQRQSISHSNVTDNATGQNMDGTGNINEDPGLPLSPTDLIGLGDWFEIVERSHLNDPFLPSAPTIASLEMSMSPQQPDDDELIDTDDDEPIAADNDESIAPDNNELILSDSDESFPGDNNELITLGNDESIAADNDEYIAADNDKYIAAGKDEPIAAGKDEPIAAGKDEPIAAGKDEPIAADKDESIAAGKDEPIVANNDKPIKADIPIADDNIEPIPVDNDDFVAANNDEPFATNNIEHNNIAAKNENPVSAKKDEPIAVNGDESIATKNEITNSAANSDTKDEVEVEGAAAAAPTEDGAIAGPSDGGSTAIPAPKKRRRPLPYTFHDLHGKNIRLRSSDTVAVRYQGFAEGVAISSQSLRRGNHFRFRVDKVAPDWLGTVCIGAVATLPTDSLPRSALHFDKPAWFLTSDVVMNRGRYRTTDMGMPLEDITENSVLTLHLKFNSELTLDVDGVMCGVIAVIPRMFTHIYPAIDLYGRVTQISILLHPHVIHGGHSLDLPVIDENFREESQGTPDDEDYGGDEDDDDEMDSPDDATSGLRPNPSLQQLAEWRNTKKNRDPETDAPEEPANFQAPGPSKRPDFLPGLPNANDAKNHEIKFKQTIPEQNSIHHSLMRTNAFEITALETFAVVRRSLSTEQFKVGFVEFDDSDDDEEEDVEEDDDDNEDSGNSPLNVLSLGSRMGDDDDSLDVPEICDTNIRHNDRYPEASDVDLLDNEIVDALTLDAGNLPDLTEEQSPSIDDSTRRDETWSDGIMHIENLTYLNNIINYNPEEAGPRFAERDWVFYSETNGNCEHMHLALKYWNYLVLPYPDMREVVASGQVRCFCPNCQPDAEPQFAGWVRIERANGGGTNHMFWHLLRSTLVSASAMSGEAAGGGGHRRPRVLCTAPSTNPSAADIWFDEEGKPHHTVIALDIDLSANMDPINDRLLAYMIYLRSHITLNEDSADPLSFED